MAEKFKVDTLLTRRGGEPIYLKRPALCPECRAKHITEDENPLTLGDAIWGALTHDDFDPKTGKRSAQRDDAKRRGKLARRVERAEDSDDKLIELADAEIKEIEELAVKEYSQIVAQQLCIKLDEPYVPEDPDVPQLTDTDPGEQDA